MIGIMSSSCRYCQKTYKFPGNLNKHLQVAHNIKQGQAKRPSFNGVVCSTCEKVFKYQSNLNRHLKEVHQVVQRNIVSYEFNAFINKCFECSLSYINIEQLRQHLTDFHLKAFPEESFQFNNEDEFNIWLSETCNATSSEYVRQKTRKTEDFEDVYYYCNRSGPIRVTPGKDRKRKRASKSQGSCKTGNACTSTIYFRMENKTGLCNIRYVALHYGHANELQHLRLPHSDRAEIAEKLVKDVSVSRILASNREKISLDNLKRKDLLTKMDITNIKNSNNISINDGVRHQIDSVSVELWIEEYKQQSNTVYYKKQGHTQDFFHKDDFCLIFMNASQEYMLKTYGNGGIICVDSTHGLNGYDFELTTILIIDEWGEGFPGACMFTNRKDTEVSSFFFSKIREKTGIIEAKTFMTDITNVFYNAWYAVMAPVQYQIFCSWHIDHAWRSNLNKILEKDKREPIYHALKVLQTEMEESKFLKELEHFIDMLLEDLDTASFGKYFVENYGNRCEKWAYVYRKSAGINTNMHLESMHKSIKYFHLGGNVVRRLDKGIHGINDYIRNKIIGRMIKQVKGKNTTHLRKIKKKARGCIKKYI